MTWTEIDDSTTASSNTVIAIKDANFSIVDDSDTTKALKFQVSGVTTATTRTATVPDADFTMVGAATTQTLTNKTIDLTSNTLTATSAQLATAVSDETGSGALVFGTSPTIVTPTIASFTNATHNHTNAAGGGQLTTAALSNVTEWTTVAYNAGDFTAQAGSWTVDEADVTTFKYRKTGKTMEVNFRIVSTDVSATPTSLNILIPGGFTAAVATEGYLRYSDAGGASTIGFTSVAASGTTILCQKATAAAFTTTAGDNTTVIGHISFETTT